MKVLSFGEILWDVYNDKKCIGGAPLNFAAHIAKHGDEAFMLSSIGKDSLGDETLDALICDEEEPDVLDCLLERNLFKELKKIFTSLDKEERDLLFKLFMSSEPLSEAEYAEEIGISQPAVHKKKICIMDKLKNYFQNFGY